MTLADRLRERARVLERFSQAYQTWHGIGDAIRVTSESLKVADVDAKLLREAADALEAKEAK